MLQRVILLGLLVVACAAEPIPTPSPAIDPTAYLPLPPAVSGIPQGGAPTAVVGPQSARGSVAPGVPMPVELGHCGLVSPLDVDGSLWNPLGGHDGRGGALTERQRGELINPSRVLFTIVEPDVATLTTPSGAVILLGRLPHARAYGLCD